ncbi:MAG: hypothetical protein WB646_19785 [Steroidobacteraceae bacterium]
MKDETPGSSPPLTFPKDSDVFSLLSAQQSLGLPMLAAGESARTVAEKLGVTPQTISLWLNHDQPFRHAIWSYRKEAFDAAHRQLQAAGIEAVGVLRQILRESKSEQMRLKAAQLLIGQLDLVSACSEMAVPAAKCSTPSSCELESKQESEAVRMAREMIGRLRKRIETQRRQFDSETAMELSSGQTDPYPRYG